jgi:hypothetical protein
MITAVKVDDPPHGQFPADFSPRMFLVGFGDLPAWGLRLAYCQMPLIPADASDVSSSRECVQCGFRSPAYAVAYNEGREPVLSNIQVLLHRSEQLI